MKKKLLFFIFIILTVSLGFTQNISLVSFTGTVQIKEKEGADWSKAAAGQNLLPGFFIYTGFNSNAVLQAGNAKIEVKPLSQVSIASLVSSKDNVATDVSLKYGKIKANVAKNEEVKTTFKVRSANSTASVRGTIFEFGNDFLKVENGTVLLENDYFNNLLVQVGERAYAGKLNVIDSPFNNRLKDFYINTLPVGMADTELDSVKDVAGKNRVRSKATVIIRITVIQ